MSRLDGWRTRLRLMLSRRAADSRIDHEFEFHIDMETDRLMRELRLDATEARRRALAAFGGVQQHKETMRDGRGLARFAGMAVDLRLGYRMLFKTPGLTTVAGLALVIAITAGAGYFEFVRDLYQPTLPGKNGERLVGIRNWDLARGDVDDRVTHDFLLWQTQVRTIEAISATRPLDANLITADGKAEPVSGAELSPAAFRLIPVRPLLGRTLLESDAAAGAAPVVVLSETLWSSRFGGDSSVIGQRIRLGTNAYTIAGVIPRSFPSSGKLWVPLGISAADSPRGEGSALMVFGRLADGVSIDEAQAELTTIGARAAAEFPATNRNLRPRVKPFLESAMSGRGSSGQKLGLYAINVFFLALLAVCCANVATLVFARTATREGEITVRTALGASRARIVAQLFAEALVLSTVSAAVALALVAFTSRWLRRLIVSLGSEVPFWWNDRLSPATLLYTAVLVVLTSAMIGIVPGLKATGTRLHDRLKAAEAGGTSMRFGRLWTGVIVGQVALTVIFLLTVVSFAWNVRLARYGAPAVRFAKSEYLTGRLEADRGDATDSAGSPTRAGASVHELERRLLMEPDVTGVTYGSQLPGMTFAGTSIEVEGFARGRDGQWARSASVGPSYFSTFGARILAGRSPMESDIERGRRVVVVDQSFVAQFMGGTDPVGRRMRRMPRTKDGKAGPWYEIVGVVEDLTVLPDPTADGIVFFAAPPEAVHPLRLAVHVTADPNTAVPRLRRSAAASDPTLRVYELMPMSDIDKVDRLVMAMVVRALFVIGAIAVLLSSAGIYSLMSFTVARRTREIGIRSAIGADPQRILAETFRQGIVQLGIGFLLGAIPGSACVAYGLPEGAEGAGVGAGFAALGGIAVFMMGVGILACLVPARRALRIQPTEALRVGG